MGVGGILRMLYIGFRGSWFLHYVGYGLCGFPILGSWNLWVWDSGVGGFGILWILDPGDFGLRELGILDYVDFAIWEEWIWALGEMNLEIMELGGIVWLSL